MDNLAIGTKEPVSTIIIKILYIHGYNGTPDGAKTDMLRSKFRKAELIALLNAIRDIQINPLDGKLHFKNHGSRHATMTVEDLLNEKLSLIDKKDGLKSDFKDADELLLAGWAID